MDASGCYGFFSHRCPLPSSGSALPVRPAVETGNGYGRTLADYDDVFSIFVCFIQANTRSVHKAYGDASGKYM